MANPEAMMAWWIAVMLAIATSNTADAKCLTSGGPKDGVLNVHIISRQSWHMSAAAPLEHHLNSYQHG
jgi:hypothetical protein